MQREASTFGLLAVAHCQLCSQPSGHCSHHPPPPSSPPTNCGFLESSTVRSNSTNLVAPENLGHAHCTIKLLQVIFASCKVTTIGLIFAAISTEMLMNFAPNRTPNRFGKPNRTGIFQNALRTEPNRTFAPTENSEPVRTEISYVYK